MRNNKLSDIKERIFMKEKRPGPGEHNPEKYESYYQKLKLGKGKNWKL